MRHSPAIPRIMKEKRQPDTPKRDAGGGINREQMISVAAYFRAESRGFAGDDSIADWLAAEAEIDAMLGKSKKVSVH